MIRLRPVSFITAAAFVFDTNSAGARPKTRLVTTQRPTRIASTRPSTVNRIQYGTFRPKASAMNCTPNLDNQSPSPPAAKASIRFSTINCRTIRQRVAPTDARIAISRARPADRARSRLATFAQAMSRTNAAVAMSASGGC